MTIGTKLLALNTVKQDIKSALVAKGADMIGVPFTQYASKVVALESGGSGGVTPPPEEWTQEYYNSVLENTSNTYIRPADWLTLPVLTDADQKFVGLFAIFEGKNYVTFTVAGAYTVNWGDGVTENFASGVTALHIYNYDTYDIANATLSTRGYKQVIVTITRQSGINLTSLVICPKPTLANLSAHISGLLDCSIAGAYLTTITLNTSSASYTKFTYLEHMSLYQNNVTSFAQFFHTCVSLRKLSTFYTNNATTMLNMFYNCATLETIPLLDTNKVTIMTAMFYSCVALKTIPLLNTVNVTNMGSMFYNCATLETIPLLDTNKVTNMISMFQLCSALTTIPLLNTINVIDMSSMFSNCYILKSIPLLDTNKVTNMSAMFQLCSALKTIPLLNTNKVTNMGSMFYNCGALKSIPLLDTNKVTIMTAMFQLCSALTSVNLFCILVTTISSIFSTASALRNIILKDIGAVSIVFSALQLTLSSINGIIKDSRARTAVRTFTFTNNIGLNDIISVSKTCTTTANSCLITVPNITSLLVGMSVSGGNITIQGLAKNITTFATTDIATLTSHGLIADSIIYILSDIASTTLNNNTPYYLVNVTANTFQLALSRNGTPISFGLVVNTSTIVIRVCVIIEEIINSTTIRLTGPGTVTGSSSLTFSTLKSAEAAAKNITLTL